MPVRSVFDIFAKIPCNQTRLARRWLSQVLVPPRSYIFPASVLYFWCGWVSFAVHSFLLLPNLAIWRQLTCSKRLFRAFSCREFCIVAANFVAELQYPCRTITFALGPEIAGNCVDGMSSCREFAYYSCLFEKIDHLSISNSGFAYCWFYCSLEICRLPNFLALSAIPLIFVGI